MNDYSLHFTPLIPSWAIMTLAIIALVLVGILLLNKSRNWFLRALALSLLLFALTGPYFQQEQRDPLSTIILVGVDKSSSIHSARREALVDKIKQTMAKKLVVFPKLEVKWVTIQASEDQQEFGTRAITRMSEALSTIPEGRFGGALLITDGQIHDVPLTVPAPFLTKDLKLPLHTIIAGEKQEFDRAIKVIEAPRYGLVGKKARYKIKLIDKGHFNGARPAGTLVIRGEKQAPKSYQLLPGKEMSFEMPIQHAGPNMIELNLEPVKGELTSANNSAVLITEGVREKLRVLLVSGEPHAGERTWRNLLKSDAGVDLVHFTILRPPEKQDGTPIHQLSLIAFPTRQLFSQKLDEFDLIIFDRYFRRGVLSLHYIDNIVRYVQNGGAVLFAAGKKFSSPLSLYNTPLSEILPASPTGAVITKPYKAKVTKKGFRHPVTNALQGAGSLKAGPSWGRWLRQMEGDFLRGEILMEGADGRPLLILDRAQKGRVALLLSDHAWLWARGYDGGGPHRALLRRLAHWLMKEPDLEENALFLHGKGRSLKIERRTMDEKVPPVILEKPDGSTETITLKKDGEGLFVMNLTEQAFGLYRAHSGKLSAVAHLGLSDTKEVQDLTATDEKMTSFAKQTSAGQFFASKDTKALNLPGVRLVRESAPTAGSNWIAFKNRNAYNTLSVKKIDLAKGLLALALGLLLLGGMWWREGRK